ncbi:MAG: pseudouridine synthase, partial [Rikenellaceae bacterium]
ERIDCGDRKPFGERKQYGERKEFGDRKPFGERKQYGERKEFGDRKPFGERKQYGERKEFGDRKPFGERKPYGNRREFTPREDGERQDSPVNKNYPKYNPNEQTGEIRLNRYIAQSGLCSRREADEYITAGLVSINGVIIKELGTKVMPGDEIKFNDEQVKGEKKVYLVLNKPKGFVTSSDDPHADKTVMDLVRNACTERIYPVGRLDKNSLGVLLFTNDGDLTKQLTHPSHRKKKIYQVSLDKALTRADFDSLASGITLEDGEVYADEISYVSENKEDVGLEIHSGRNRIVRRMFEHLGYSVQKLDRVYFAGLTKKNLKRGQWRFLTNEEVERLKSGRYE